MTNNNIIPSRDGVDELIIDFRKQKKSFLDSHTEDLPLPVGPITLWRFRLIYDPEKKVLKTYGMITSLSRASSILRSFPSPDVSNFGSFFAGI